MEIIKFTDDLLVGNSIIDNRHKEIFAHVEILYQRARWGLGKAKLDQMLKFLENHIRTHFEEEENLMREYSYPEINTHADDHERFRIQVAEWIKRFECEKETFGLVVDMVNNSLLWLCDHLKQRDLKLANFIQTAHKFEKTEVS